MDKRNRQTNGVRILGITRDSPAALSGLQPGDRLISLEGQPVEDILDLQYHLGDGGGNLEVERDGARLKVHIELEEGEDPGWELQPLHLRSCHCRCIFCFVDQLPRGMRSSLYQKDEDYRFSFLFGNYLTLVGMSSSDVDRIVRLHLSPLYVSIHATDPGIRGRLLGLKSAPILPRLVKLIERGIQIHGQIVIVPDYNDGAVLERTLEELAPFYPGLASLSVVPVGLSKHRDKLTSLRLMISEEARRTLEIVISRQQVMLRTRGSRWVFPADELMLLAGQTFPPEEAYEGHPQIENGVGLVRWTLQQAEEALSEMPSKLETTRRLVWVTGRSASSVLEKLAERFERCVAGLTIDIVQVDNHLLGDSVTVAGLLGGKDIALSLESYLRSSGGPGITEGFLPPDCVNGDGLFLDNYSPDDIQRQVGMPVRVFDGDWRRMIFGEEAP